jgi:bla regulator protein BlaR1
MLQALLEDRFKLKVHRETREAPVYVLTVAKSGSKLEPFKEGSCVSLSERGDVAGDTVVMPQISRSGTLDSGKLVDSAGVQHPICAASNGGEFRGNSRTVEVQGQDLKMIGWLLGVSLDRPVIDRTGLTGKFDAHVEFAVDPSPQNPFGPDGQTTPPANKPSIFTAVQEELGLKLEPGRGPVEILIIDHVEKPSEN